MKWSDLFAPASVLASRLPLSNLIAGHRDKSKAIEKFVATLPAANPDPSVAVQEASEVPPQNSAAAPSSMPTTEETIAGLKRELGKEMYRFQIDLARGCKIAGKPCDCCEKHPLLAIEAMAEELVPMDPSNPIYSECTQWIKANADKLTMEAAASRLYDTEYPQMAATWRDFRKQLMGTGKLTAMVSPEGE